MPERARLHFCLEGEITTDANGVSTIHKSILVDGLTPDLLGTFEIMVFDGAFLTSEVIVPEILAPADLAVGDDALAARLAEDQLALEQYALAQDDELNPS